MNLSFDFIKSISVIYDEMRGNGFSLIYMGEFSHEITKMFANMAQVDMDRKSEERALQRKVYHVIVETLQNMNKHSAELSGNDVGSGLFVIGKRDDTYYVFTSNKVKGSDRARLESSIAAVNGASREELREMYKGQLMDGALSAKQGAGLGLIDIARKTGRPLDYTLIPLDEDSTLFILKVEINARNV